MLNTKSMLSNISKGQSAINMKYILQGLEAYYQSIKAQIQPKYVGDVTDGKTMVFFKVPSGSISRLQYDVVFEFYETVKLTTNTEFKVYCNSPAFYYTYANLFKRLGSLLYPEKYPSLLKLSAEVRNKGQVAGFDKYVYSCLRFSIQYNLDELRRMTVSNSQPPVSTFDEKYAEYTRLKQDARQED